MSKPFSPTLTLLTLAALISLPVACKRKDDPARPPAPPRSVPDRPATPIEDSPGTPNAGAQSTGINSPPNLFNATPGTELRRAGDEIMVAGRLFHTGTRVILFSDPGGYDGYRVERRFAPFAEAPWAEPVITGSGKTARLKFPTGQPDRPNRYGLRDGVLTWPEFEQVRGGGWPLDLLQQKVDQFVLHFDAVGTSQSCFRTLQDDRGLSVHLMLDIDGTIYQTLDLKERALHATTSNQRSVGIEIANRGAYESDLPLREFYARDGAGTRITLPPRFGDGGLRIPGIYRPDRPAPIRGTVNDLNLIQYDLTPEQYAALAHLTATLCTALPKITLDYPRDTSGDPAPNKLPDGKLATYQGLLAHSNVQANKYDPGPAFQWDRLIKESRTLMTPEALSANRAAQNKPVLPGTVTTPTPTRPLAR